MSEETSVARGSGNVFADLGLPQPDERLAKAMLSRAIQQLIREKGLTQAAAAERIGCAQPDVSRITRGDVSGFSLERLSAFLNALGQDVEIVVRPSRAASGVGHLRVAVAV